MKKILGIDTSNYTTSVAVVEDNVCIYDSRKLLNTKLGERGLRQSEALFQHIQNIPNLLCNNIIKNFDAICVSVRPRPVEGSYMPVFKGGESIAYSIGHATGIRVYETSHQEGHIEAAVNSIKFREKEFIAIHLSGGTTEILKVTRNKDYKIEIIGGTKDISIGQFIDRIGVSMGLQFPSGKEIDAMAVNCRKSDIRIPSKVEGLSMNFSGQETLCLKYLKEGYNQGDIAFSTMLCVAKTLEKLLINLFRLYKLPVILVGGVACSSFLKNYFQDKFIGLLNFSEAKYASDNAVGVAFIGYRKLTEE